MFIPDFEHKDPCFERGDLISIIIQWHENGHDHDQNIVFMFLRKFEHRNVLQCSCGEIIFIDRALKRINHEKN
jgi:hypothetical protein